MKKFILTVALVLAVVTSLVAGTMAAYTQQLDETTGTLSAKKFNIVSNTSDGFSEALQVAPGSSVVYQVEVTNSGEVDTKLDMDISILGAGKDQIDRLQLDIREVKLISATSTTTKQVLLSSDKLAVGETAIVTFVISWPYEANDEANALDNADMSLAASYIQVNINAVGLSSAALPIK
ncbi:MAG: hypothetical protein ABFC31_03290 [Clostridiaceae bacterium]